VNFFCESGDFVEKPIAELEFIFKMAKRRADAALSRYLIFLKIT